MKEQIKESIEISNMMLELILEDDKMIPTFAKVHRKMFLALVA